MPCDDHEGEEEYHRLDGYRALGQPRVAVELTVGGGKAEDRRAVSAEQVAQRLSRYVGEGKHGAGDVALLLGSLHNVGAYLDALRAHGIECVVTGGSTFSQAPEVATVAALLHVLANPGDTKAGLYPVLASGLFALDADDFLALSTRQHETTGLPANRPVDDGLWDWGFMPGYVPSERMARAREVLERAVSRMGSWRVGQVMEAVLEESGWPWRPTPWPPCATRESWPRPTAWAPRGRPWSSTPGWTWPRRARPPSRAARPRWPRS